MYVIVYFIQIVVLYYSFVLCTSFTLCCHIISQLIYVSFCIAFSGTSNLLLFLLYTTACFVESIARFVWVHWRKLSLDRRNPTSITGRLFYQEFCRILLLIFVEFLETKKNSNFKLWYVLVESFSIFICQQLLYEALKFQQSFKKTRHNR